MDVIAITMEPPATIRPSIKALLLVSLIGWVTSCGQGLIEKKDPGKTPQPSPNLQDSSGKISADLTFDQWLAKCQSLPSNRLLKGAMPERSLLPIQDPESLTRMLDLFIEQQLSGPMSKSEAWENNSDTPDITIEINDSTSTMEESSVTEAEDDDNKANLTIAEFLEETETIANDLVEDADDMFSSLITKANGQTWENVDLGDSNIPPPLLLQENLRLDTINKSK